jgi:lipid-binding SYLF domain-containing protein
VLEYRCWQHLSNDNKVHQFEMVNTPIPHSLRSEARKAAKILRDFTMPSAKTGPDKIIPAGVIVKAEGLAILTVVKIGFLVTARAGSGIVVARLGPRDWSAPSAIGIAGLGGGFEVGAEVTDFVIILNRKSAVEAFSKGGNVTLGGNLTIAAGPLGRNVEGDVAIRSTAAIYTYSKTRGLFAGISIEGSYLMERKDANRKFYCRDIRAHEILSGQVDATGQCEELYSILGHHEDMFERVLEAKARQAAARGSHVTRSFFVREKRSSQRSIQSSSITHRSASSSDVSGDRYGAAYKGSWAEKDETDDSDLEPTTHHHSSSQMRRSGSANFATGELSVHSGSRSSFVGGSEHHTVGSRPSSKQTKTSSAGARPKTPSSVKGKSEWDKPATCKALWTYKAQLPCDLSFLAGDVIEVRTRTHTQDDWWEGVTADGRIGIFPANYVQLL